MSDSEAPDPEDRPSTWQSRCPLKPVIEPRAQPKKNITTAQKISNNEKRLIKKKNALALQEEIDKHFEERAGLITKLASDFSKTPEYIRDLLSRSSNAVSHRGLNLENALIHFESKKVNGGESYFDFCFPFMPKLLSVDRVVGDRYKLPEIRLMMKEDEELKNLSAEREAELMADLKEHRATHKQGARASNRAAALDYQGTIKHIHQEVSI